MLYLFLNLHKFACDHVPIDMLVGLLSKHFEKLSDSNLHASWAAFQTHIITVSKKKTESFNEYLV